MIKRSNDVYTTFFHSEGGSKNIISKGKAFLLSSFYFYKVPIVIVGGGMILLCIAIIFVLTMNLIFGG